MDELAWLPLPKNLCLEEDLIHVWFVSLKIDQSKKNVLERTLSTDELERAARYNNQKLRDRYVIGRGCLRHLLGQVIRQAPETISFEYGPHGKPSIRGSSLCTGVSFNLAHSGEGALIAIGLNREIGVDLEQVERITDEKGISERFFTKSESKYIRSLPSSVRQKVFLTYWTCKEAYVKATGLGLSCPLDQFEVVYSPGGQQGKIVSVEKSFSTTDYAFHLLFPGSRYTGAVVSKGFNWKVFCWQRPE